eukprot:TRINITY_DN3051_c0_g1_i2.p1 TRINITY_DN3051_c0_g1~~TRINITY_DN3051_c0_g1_i2.p1  ORF type:complete len:592 (+),score=104.90 TRINITY_DN3051_c0_g1_i2:15-1790(+)
MEGPALEPLVLNIISFSAETLVAFAIVVLLLRRYLSFTHTPLVVYATTWLGYFFSVAIFFLMPVDVGITNYLQCLFAHNETMPLPLEEDGQIPCVRPINYIEPGPLEIIWNIIYWTTYVCTWVVYPILQSYVMSGEFTMRGKLKEAIKQNLIFYGISALVCVIIFIVLCIVTQGWAKAWEVAIFASNLWGFLVLFLLLGYGIVYIPRTLWREANRTVTLKYCHFQLVDYYQAAEQHALELENTLKLIKLHDDKISTSSDLRVYVDTMLLNIPRKFYNYKKGEGQLGTTYEQIVELNTRLNTNLHDYLTAECLFDETYKEAIELERIISIDSNNQNKFATTTNTNGDTDRLTSIITSIKSTTYFVWVKISPVLYRMLAILCGIMSIALVWSEVVFPFPEISVAGVFSNIAWATEHNSFLLQGFSFFTICYMGICTYASLFNLKLFRYYQLLPHQRTDGNSILFSAAYLSRLTAPLCLNFLHVIGYASAHSLSPFIRIQFPDSVVVQKLQTTVYNYFPLVLVVFGIIHIFNLHNKLLSLCKIKRFDFSENFNDSQIEEGERIVRREKQARNDGSTILATVGVDKSPSNDKDVC